MNRRLREVVVVGLVIASLASVVVAAVHADARTSIRTETNDGGAWLVRRSDGVVGQMNRTAGEVTGLVRVSNPGAEFDVEQADTTIVTHDTSTGELQVIDPRTYQIVNTVTVPGGVRVRAVNAGVIVWRPEPLRVWALSRDDLGAIVSLDDVAPLLESEGSGLVTTTFDGELVVVDSRGGEPVDGADPDAESGRVGIGDPLRGEPVDWTDVGAAAAELTAVSAIGRDVIALGADGTVVRLDDGDDAFVAPPVTSEPTDNAADAATGSAAATDPEAAVTAVLAQPSPQNTPLVAVTAGGQVLGGVDAASGAALTPLDEIGAGEPLAPIVHEGCVFNVATSPPTFTRMCNGVADQTEPLTGADPSALRLRLVNGWVWINDLTSGTLWIAGTDSELERIDDWGSTLGSEGDEPDENPGDQEDGKTEENPDIGEIRDPEIDEDGVNEPPVARDDVARTRADQPVVVDVLANDEDPDGDALMVATIDGVPAEVAVAVTPDQRSVQVVPPPGFTGNIAFSYTVSDGRGASASANVDVDVVSNDASNRPPIAQTDIAEVRGGASAAFNVLNNDSDPDGDTFVLSDVQVPSGRVIFDPSGEIKFTPEPGSQAGTIELQYQIVDSFGATAERHRSGGDPTRHVEQRARRRQRLGGHRRRQAGHPQRAGERHRPRQRPADRGRPSPARVVEREPERARRDHAHRRRRVLLPRRPSPATTCSCYAIIDGSERDAAYIRVRVDEPTENRPPTAIRDDVTIGRGGTRNVYVLRERRRPGRRRDRHRRLVGRRGHRGRTGARLRASGSPCSPDAPARTQFTLHDLRRQAAIPSTGTVVVAVSDTDTLDQPPVARPDTVEVRPGRSDLGPGAGQRLRPRGRHAARRRRVADVPGADLRIGPGRPGDLRVGRRRRPSRRSRSATTWPTRAATRRGSLVQVRLVPTARSTARRSPAPTWPARSPARRSTSPCSPTTPIPTATRSTSRPSRAQPAFGTATVRYGRHHPVHAAAGESGSDRFRYTVVDANGDRAVGEVLIGVLPADGENRAPTATDDTYTVIAGSDSVVLDVLDNDSDPDGDPLSIADVDSGSDAVAIDPAGGISFEPPLALAGAGTTETVSFTYAIADGRGGTDRALVTVQIVESGVPIAPIAVDDIAGPFCRGQGVAVERARQRLRPRRPRRRPDRPSDDPRCRSPPTAH